MTFEDARMKHAEWRHKFRHAIKNKEVLDAPTIARDDCCDFGKWLRGEARVKFSRLKSFQECVDSHSTFHVEASRIAMCINAKNYTEAEELLKMGAPFSKVSGAINGALTKLEIESRSKYD